VAPENVSRLKPQSLLSSRRCIFSGSFARRGNYYRKKKNDTGLRCATLTEHLSRATVRWRNNFGVYKAWCSVVFNKGGAGAGQCNELYCTRQHQCFAYRRVHITKNRSYCLASKPANVKSAVFLTTAHSYAPTPTMLSKHMCLVSLAEGSLGWTFSHCRKAG
jgi:hypothetical protein